MKTATMRVIGRILVVSMLALPFAGAHAGMIGTDQVVVNTSARLERANLVRTIDRPEVTQQLQTLGVDAKTAKQRVAAMTDAEVHTLAGQVAAVPAGADMSGWGWAILIALAVWAFYAWR